MNRLSLRLLAGMTFCVFLTPGRLFSQDERAAAQAQVAEVKSAPLNLTLDGERVNVQTLQQLSGYDWRRVTLRNARFDGAIIESLRKAESIESLWLSGDGLSGQIPRLRHVKGLKGLELYVPLLGRDLRAIGGLTELEHLTLPQEITINVTGARAIAQLVNLKSLRLYNVDIDDASFKEFHTLTQLEELNLTHTSISDDGLRTLAAMPHLKELQLLRYGLNGPDQLTDASIPVIAKLTELESLSLSGGITKAGLQQIAGLPKLKQLNLFATNLTLNDLEPLQNSPVENLTLRTGAFGVIDTGLENLRKIPNLKNLTIIGQPVQFDFEKLQKLLPGVGLSFLS